MRFWDASAIVPLLTAQSTSAAASRLWREDSSLVVWWGTAVECVSALTRLARERKISPSESAEAMRRLQSFAGAWSEIEPSIPLRDIAIRIMGSHSLRAADALQLAAAVFWREQTGAMIPVVTFDQRLLAAAQAERLPTIGQERRS
ncbi:MAG TPA: PIN domain-containing protein [Casimicrobiaceae bacterium]|nr:PIN domain-containing protein [Casimicrobiaceae bacterium]